MKVIIIITGYTSEYFHSSHDDIIVDNENNNKDFKFINFIF
jgi:hypothetical protein